MKINVLAIAAHPDDVELGCGGTLLKHKQKGQTTGIIDLTRGEMGTRGTPEIRDEEARRAAEILELDVRENMNFRDVFFQNDEAHRLKLAQQIRKFQPDIVLANAESDRHPDHGRGANLIEEAVFLAGLKKIETRDEQGNLQSPWRPQHVYHMIQSISLEPQFLVDVTDVHQQKMDAIMAYQSQFYDPDSKEPETYISSPEFLSMLEARSREYGHRIGVKYAEGFTSRNFLGIRDMDDLI